MHPPDKSKFHAKLLPTILSYGVAAACLYWVFHDLDFGELARSFAGVNWWWVPPAIAFDLLVYVVAGWEWQILLQPAARMSLIQTTQAIFAGRYANDVLPFHVGYVIRVYLVSRWAPASVASVAPSVLVEQLVDGFWLALGIGVAAIFFPLPKAITVGARIWVGIILFSVAVGAVILFRRRKPGATSPNDSPIEPPNRECGDCSLPLLAKRGEGWGEESQGTRGIFRVVPDKVHGQGTAAQKIARSKWAAKFYETINHVFDQLREIGSSWILPASVALSLLKLAIQFLAFACLFQAHHFRFPITVQLAVFLLAYAGLSMPSTPASVGVFQLFCIAGLRMFDVPKEQAAGFALLAFAVLTLPLSVAGFFALAQSGLTLHKVRTEAGEWKSR